MNNNVFKYKQKYRKDGTPNYEFLQTPIEICDWMQALIVYHSETKPHTYLDPCMGNGRLGEAIRIYDLNAEIIGFDIQNTTKLNVNYNYSFQFFNTNFLDERLENKYDAVICNPPFSLANMFIEKCYDLLNDNGVMSFVLPISYWFSIGRLSSKYNPTVTYCLAPRVSFTGNKITSPKDEYIICVWKKNLNSHTIERLHWNIKE